MGGVGTGPGERECSESGVGERAIAAGPGCGKREGATGRAGTLCLGTVWVEEFGQLAEMATSSELKESVESGKGMLVRELERVQSEIDARSAKDDEVAKCLAEMAGVVDSRRMLEERLGIVTAELNSVLKEKAHLLSQLANTQTQLTETQNKVRLGGIWFMSAVAGVV